MLVLAESKEKGTGVRVLKNVNALVSLGWGGGRPCASRRPLLIIYVRN